MPVTKAVIPAAGLGSRMMPLTDGAPKEMLLIGGRPMIHHVVQEAIDSGVREICIVIRKGKESIRRYFETGKLPNATSAEAKRTVWCLHGRSRILFTEQSHPQGLGDALLCARDFVGRTSFAMLIPDQLFTGSVPPLAQMKNNDIPDGSVVSSMIRIPRTETGYFSGARRLIFRPNEAERKVVVITGIAPAGPTPRRSVLRGFGRTIYPPQVFSFLSDDFADPQTGEVDLLKTFRALLHEVPNYGVILEGHALDLGTIAAYQYFSQKIAMTDPRHKSNRSQ
jgi:UTP--glucose-1-phosphate uridylyltransferase